MNIQTKIIDTEALSILNRAKESIVVMRTTNKLGDKARNYIKTYISKTYFLKKKEVWLSARKATRNRLTYRIGASPFFLRPSTFPFKQTGSGVDVKVKRQGTPLQLPGYFIAQPSGRDWSMFGQTKRVTATKPMIFKRQRSTGKYKNYPIERDRAQEETMSPGQVMVEQNVLREVKQIIDTDGPRIFDSELTYVLTGKRKL